MRWILVDHHLDQDHYHCMTGGASVTKKDKVQMTEVHVVAADLGGHGIFPQGVQNKGRRALWYLNLTVPSRKTVCRIQCY